MGKRKEDYGCENCISFKDKLKAKEYELEQKVRSITETCMEARKDADYWRKRANAAELRYTSQFDKDLQLDSVESDTCTPDDLQIHKMHDYYEGLLQKYPTLETVLRPLFSKHFQTKEKSRSADSRWIACAGLYRAFVADVVLRSKNSKAVLRTNMLLGVLVYQSRCPDSIWRLFQRLKILPTRDTVEKFLKSCPAPDFSVAKFVITHYDNCDIYRHVTKRFTNHMSDYLHLVTRQYYEVSRVVKVPLADIYKPYNAEEALKFSRFLLMDFGDQCELAKNASDIVSAAKGFGGLKFAVRETSSQLTSAKLINLPVEVDKQTISHADVASIVRNLWDTVGKPYGRDYCIMGGDWQTFSRMWELKIKQPDDFKYVIPFPGEWHWNWHILQGIFKIWGHYLLKPFAVSVLGYKNFDVKCKNFHYGEHLLEVVTIGILNFLDELREKHPGEVDMGLQTHYRGYSHLYELLYFWNWYICMYWLTRSALKAGDSATINEMWRYWLQLFITTKKHNYAIMSIRFLWLLQFLHPDIVAVINSFRTYSFSDAKMTRIPLDGLNELVRSAI